MRPAKKIRMRTICGHGSCIEPAVARGLCQCHYDDARRPRSTDIRRGVRRYVVTHVTIEPAVLEQVRERAAAGGLTVSAWVRERIVETLGSEP